MPTRGSQSPGDTGDLSGTFIAQATPWQVTIKSETVSEWEIEGKVKFSKKMKTFVYVIEIILFQLRFLQIFRISFFKISLRKIFENICKKSWKKLLFVFNNI